MIGTAPVIATMDGATSQSNLAWSELAVGQTEAVHPALKAVITLLAASLSEEGLEMKAEVLRFSFPRFDVFNLSWMNPWIKIVFTKGQQNDADILHAMK